MELNDYQAQARRTETPVFAAGGDNIVPILGLAGEVGELLNEYKKRLRDGEAHLRFADRVSEELGDILWYVAATASRFGLSLEEVAARNLVKTRARWGVDGPEASGARRWPEFEPHVFDAAFPESERFPRRFTADFRESLDERGTVRITVSVDGVQMGHVLSDNAHSPDGYRFHDVFHLTCVAVLGWSAVVRKHLKRKRRSDPKVDEVEDGGRAMVTEEGISALVFAYAVDHGALYGVCSVDYDILKAIRIMTSGFEVAVCTTGEWEHAIFLAYEIWRQVQKNGGGKVDLDLDRRSIRYVGK